jgi:hypothetical protein
MVFPADKAGDRFAGFHASSLKDPVIGFCTDPISATVDGFDVAGSHQEAFVGTVFRKRAMFFSACECDGSLTAVGAATEQDTIWFSEAVGSKGGDPADAVT